MAVKKTVKKTGKAKTPNLGATIQRARVKAWARRYALKYRGFIDVQMTIGELISFLDTAPFRAARREGGLGRK